LDFLKVLNPEYGDSNRKELGFSLDDMLTKCQFNKNLCDLNDFEWYFDFHYGNCFKFNTGANSSGHSVPLKYSAIPGEENGLFLSFMLPDIANQFSYADTIGLRIFIHNNSLRPSSSENIILKPGSLTNIAVERTIINKEPFPYSDCINIEHFKFTGLSSYSFDSAETYRQSDCLNSCLQMNINENCKCYYLRYPKVPNSDVKPCLNTTELLCASTEYKNFVEKGIEKYSKFCPLECNEILFEMTLSSADFPAKSWYEIQKNDKSFMKKHFTNSTISFENVKKKMVGVKIFYPRLKLTSIIEMKKITFLDLLSGIGGTLGLFCGLNIWHLIKFAEKVAFKCVNNKKKSPLVVSRSKIIK
jgi:hypothetical protein